MEFLLSRAAEVDVCIEGADEEAGGALLAAMEHELDELYRDRPGTLNSHPVSPADFLGSDGTFVVLRIAGEPVACGGVKRLGPDTAEIKRMFVVPRSRGRGLARRLLDELEAQARRLGYGRVRLDTGPDQPAARSLYERSGYEAIPAYNDNLYAAHWFEKALP